MPRGTHECGAWTALTLTLGLLAKPMLVTWPFVMLLLDYWPLRRLSQSTSRKNFLVSIAPLLREKLPLFAIVAASCVITFFAQSIGGAVRTFKDVPIALRMLNVLVSYAKYLLLTFWPHVVLLVLATLTNAQIHLWSDSFTLFKHALAVTPPNLIIENSLGIAMDNSGRYDEAAAHFEKALQVQRDHHEVLVNMGVTRYHQAQMPEAIEYYQAAIRSQPDAPEAHVQLGLALWKQNRNEAAYDEVRRASQLAPKDANIRNYLGIALGRLGRFPEAIDQLHEAQRLNPNGAEVHYNLGLALLASGKPQESIPEFETALRLKPELKGAADNLRRAQAQLK
jgi:Flp pilus assembly protein TadD